MNLYIFYTKILIKLNSYPGYKYKSGQKFIYLLLLIGADSILTAESGLLEPALTCLTGELFGT